jgi:hypothetical protein
MASVSKPHSHSGTELLNECLFVNNVITAPVPPQPAGRRCRLLSAGDIVLRIYSSDLIAQKRVAYLDEPLNTIGA